ncbi:PIG-P [Fomitiporia mediterranea MF3/22]|uniref:PIG-P n=1 Tax=Fomitiporia mediterranea (strain MF3/22) TaxID=694068 RepID=R7SHL6_FOMME|nr:PIG-P [Fomitiporia mediterranea MF3/22]EJC97752.1 PIG-P [Fomitiporia mediterranea MF3/22]
MDSSNEPTSPRSPLAPYPSDPAQLKSRAPEFYGFVAWSSTYALFVLYVLWALLPDTWILSLGIEWYPNREWAVLLPAYSVILILLTYFTYWALALYNTPSFSDLSTITDTHAHIPTPRYGRDERATSLNTNPFLTAAAPDAIPSPYDIPIGLVNRVLYA